MHCKLFHILSFTINYYYHNYIKILLYRYSMDGCTMHICRRDLFLLCLTSGSGWAARTWLVFFVRSSWFRLIYWSPTSQVLIASSAHVPVFLIYYSTTASCFLFLLVCWTDSMAGYPWCTVTDVLFAHMTSSCASSSSCANWSYCTMLCVRIRYGFVSLLSDVM